MAATTQSSIAVPPLNLRADYDALADELSAAVGDVARSGMYVLGETVTTFEQSLATYCDARYALGLSSGTDALLLAMMALDIGPGDEVIVPNFTFFATGGCVWRLGARPVFCDIEPGTFNIDPAALEPLITDRTRAIIPVHLYGQLADMRAIQAIAERHGVAVIEDAAQAIGAHEEGLGSAGSIGTIGCLSFYPTKNLGAFGDAGGILTNDEALFEKCRKLRIHGSGHTYYHDMIGGNFRIDAIQAAVLDVKLRKLEEWTERRRSIASTYCTRLQECGLVPEKIRLPEVRHGRHVYHQFVVRAADRDALVAYARERNVSLGVYYPLPLSLQKCFGEYGHSMGDFPMSEQAAAEVCALPIYPSLSPAQLDAVVDTLRSFYHR